MMERKANVLKDSQLLPSKVCPFIKQRALGGNSRTEKLGNTILVTFVVVVVVYTFQLN